jgi:phosphatidylinositol-3-phosphatase
VELEVADRSVLAPTDERTRPQLGAIVPVLDHSPVLDSAQMGEAKAAVGSVLVAIALGACGGAPSGSSHPHTPTSSAASSTTQRSTAGSSTTSSSAPTTPHVMVIMMENKNYADVIGQSTQPFTNSLANSYGVATQSFAFGHPSLPNYLELISGYDQGVTDDNSPSAHSFPNASTLADQLAAKGVSERAYAEDLPRDPTNNAGEYAVRHFPWEYFPRTKMAIADASSLMTDLNSTDPPQFVWYTPNLIDDEHDGTVQQGDAFLARLVPDVQSTAWYRSDGQIVIEWDESDSDNTGINGGDGGHVPTIVVSAALKAAPTKQVTPVDTAGILRSIEDRYGVGHLGAAADSANGTIGMLLRATGGQ